MERVRLVRHPVKAMDEGVENVNIALQARHSGVPGLLKCVLFARHSGMDAGNHRPRKAMLEAEKNVNITVMPSLVTGFQRSLLE